MADEYEGTIAEALEEQGKASPQPEVEEGAEHEHDQAEQDDQEDEAASDADEEGDDQADANRVQDGLPAGVRKRIDKITAARRRAEREADYWRNEALRRQEQGGHKPDQRADTGPKTPSKPVEAQYSTYEEYNDAMIQWHLDVREAKRQHADQQAARAQAQQEFQAKLAQGAAKYQDFEDVVFGSNVPASDAMIQAMRESDHVADVAYHLGKHPQEAARIAALGPVQAAREIGRLEARFERNAAPQPRRQASRAPDPIPARVGGSETTNPDPDSLPIDEWMRRSRAGELRYR